MHPGDKETVPLRWNVRKAAVLGAGTMGLRVAAHLANNGIPTNPEYPCETKRPALSSNQSEERAE